MTDKKSMDTLKKLSSYNPLNINELMKYARQYSNFYKSLYKDLPDIAPIEKFPLTPSEQFWASNKSTKNTLLTGPLDDGILLRSGGTTGNPKFSVYSKIEWEICTQLAGEKFGLSHIESKDRVANLFFAGGLYGSYLFATRILELCPIDVVHLPIAGHTSNQEMGEILEQFKPNVLMGVPGTIIGLADHLRKNKMDGSYIKKIFFAGDFFFGDQESLIKSIFKNAAIYPISYASSDAGLIGYHDKTCGKDEYRSIDDYIHVEILDEHTLKNIDVPGKEGIIVITNLFRKLMPIIRYPAGDRGMWVENTAGKDRKFKLLGRSDEAARAGGIKFYVSEVRSLLNTYKNKIQFIDFQMILEHKNLKDHLTIKIATISAPKNLKRYEKEIISQLINSRPKTEILEAENICILIEWVLPEHLITSLKTGKIKRVIDQRE